MAGDQAATSVIAHLWAKLRLPVIGLRGERVHFLGDVDPGGAPGDTASASHTSAGPELVMPAAQLVGDPMPVARFAGLAHGAAVDEGEVEFEAGCPVRPPFGVLTGEVGDVFGGGAEAGGAHHGAVPASQASAGDVVPVR